MVDGGWASCLTLVKTERRRSGFTLRNKLVSQWCQHQAGLELAGLDLLLRRSGIVYTLFFLCFCTTQTIRHFERLCMGG